MVYLASGVLSRLRRPLGHRDAELLGVLLVQPLPACELHRLTTGDAANGISAKKAIQNIEADVPPGSTHRDEAAIEGMPHRQARAVCKRFQFPSGIGVTPVVLKDFRSVGSRHFYFGNLGSSHPAELHGISRLIQIPIGFKRSPLAQMRGLSKRAPNLFRFVAQLSDENERPHFSILFYLRTAG